MSIVLKKFFIFFVFPELTADFGIKMREKPHWMSMMIDRSRGMIYLLRKCDIFARSGLRVSEQKRLSIVFVTRSQQSKEKTSRVTAGEVFDYAT